MLYYLSKNFFGQEKKIFLILRPKVPIDYFLRFLSLFKAHLHRKSVDWLLESAPDRMWGEDFISEHRSDFITLLFRLRDLRAKKTLFTKPSHQTHLFIQFIFNMIENYLVNRRLQIFLKESIFQMFDSFSRNSNKFMKFNFLFTILNSIFSEKVFTTFTGGLNLKVIICNTQIKIHIKIYR